MTIIDFLKATEIRPNYVRTHVICKDGFDVSVQFGPGYRCNMRDSLEPKDWVNVGKKKLYSKNDYQTVEMGFPSEKIDIWMEYAEDKKDPCETVYNYVPVELVQKGLDLHGGIDEVATFGEKE